jgi:hypothetical protein
MNQASIGKSNGLNRLDLLIKNIIAAALLINPLGYQALATSEVVSTSSSPTRHRLLVQAYPASV